MKSSSIIFIMALCVILCSGITATEDADMSESQVQNAEEKGSLFRELEEVARVVDGKECPPGMYCATGQVQNAEKKGSLFRELEEVARAGNGCPPGVEVCIG